MGKYFKFRDTFVFDDKWQLCYLHKGSNSESINWEELGRWDWVKTTYKIDLFTGDINEIFASFEWTYIKNMEIKRKVWKVTDLIEITEDLAIDIIKNNQLSVSYLLEVQTFKPVIFTEKPDESTPFNDFEKEPVILEEHDNSKAIWWECKNCWAKNVKWVDWTDWCNNCIPF